MKCPKCGYLGFESGDRCRNCGYEFSLSDGIDPLDLALDLGRRIRPRSISIASSARQSLRAEDLRYCVIGARDTVPAADLPLFGREDAPLISAPSRPRAPLGVRRATPEVPRARTRDTRTPTQEDTLFATPHAAGACVRAHSGTTGGDALAGASSRILAALVDIALLSALDASVLYFTLRLLGLATGQFMELPLLPLVAFLLLLNGGYFIAFTTVGGQSIGKMALGIKVISQEESAVPIGRATLRTLAYIVSALPLGAGFLPGVMSADRLALHDRLAHTRVVRPSST